MPVWFFRSPAPGPHFFVSFGQDALTLRPFTMQDVAAFTTWTRALLAAPDMPAYLLTYPRSFHHRHARARIRQTYAWARQGRGWSLAIEWRGQLVGQAQIIVARPRYRVAEIAYWVAPPFQRRGLASAAMAELIRQACANWPLERIEATVVSTNQPSLGLLNHLGFTYRELESLAYRVQGSWRQRRADVLVYEKPVQ